MAPIYVGCASRTEQFVATWELVKVEGLRLEVGGVDFLMLERKLASRQALRVFII